MMKFRKRRRLSFFKHASPIDFSQVPTDIEARQEGNTIEVTQEAPRELTYSRTVEKEEPLPRP